MYTWGNVMDPVLPIVHSINSNEDAVWSCINEKCKIKDIVFNDVQLNVYSKILISTQQGLIYLGHDTFSSICNNQ